MFDPIMLTEAETDWASEMFGKVRIWSNAPLDDDQILTVGNIWLNAITNGEISRRTAAQGLRLALSLKTMAQRGAQLLFSTQTRPLEGTDNMLPTLPMPALDNFSNVSYTLRTQQVAIHQHNANLQNEPVREDNNQVKCISYSFIAAYLMRMLSKSPENAIGGVGNMKMRFKSFYGVSRIVANFRLTLAQASTYREALNSEDLIGNTYTHAVAYTHQYMSRELGQRELGVLTYLAFLPLSYTGLHSYTLMLELKVLTKAKLHELLGLFHANIMAPALAKISHIATTMERTRTHPDRDITFRYCAFWGSQYYATLRSKNCPHLLYTLAWARKSLAVGHNDADPEKIVATNSLSAQMKSTLKRAGLIAGEDLRKAMLQTEIAQEDDEDFLGV